MGVAGARWARWGGGGGGWWLVLEVCAMRFTLHCSDGSNERRFYYDNESSVLEDESGQRIPRKTKACRWERTPHTSVGAPTGKVAQIRTMKIQLGLSCNYSCEYCSQRFVPHAGDGHPSDVKKFVRNLDLWLTGEPQQIEFWGGEPFAYWKTLKPLAEALRQKFTAASFLIITNGSLLNEEINQWIVDMNVNVGI